MNNKQAFTLAEVLITLGIIGGVAALTLPSLVNSYKKQVTLNKVKHTYNILNNTLEMAKTEYGTDISQWNIPEGTIQVRSMYFVENYMLPYLKVLKYCKDNYEINTICGEKASFFTNGGDSLSPSSKNDGTNFILNDGTNIHVYVGRGNRDEDESINRVLITFDIDGANKGLNTFGYDVFRVELGGSERLKAQNKFLPYNYDSTARCDRYVGNHPHACNKSAVYGGSECLAYIVCNGWDFGKKYPW